MTNNKNETMQVVFVGHVDHGKSTIIGRLLADTNVLPKGKLEQIKAKCKRAGKPFEYALLIDALKDEQAQSITIDAARVFFQSKKRHYLILDAPGHIEFIKNMLTGASHAEAAILVIDAKEGIQENTRRHAYLLCLLGIKQVIVVVNKMDLVDYDESVYLALRQAYQQYLDGIGLKPHAFVPISGADGGNIVHRQPKMCWYDGPTMLEALDEVEKDQPLPDLPLRMPVQDVYRFSDREDDRRIVAGSIASGNLRIGDEIILLPSGKKTHVKSIEGFNMAQKRCAKAGAVQKGTDSP